MGKRKHRQQENSRKVITIKNLEGLWELVADDNMDNCVSVTRMWEVIGMNPDMLRSAWSQMYIPISWMMIGRKMQDCLKKHFMRKNLDPQMHPNTTENTVTVPEGVDAELLGKVLSNPEMAAPLTSLAKTMK